MVGESVYEIVIRREAWHEEGDEWYVYTCHQLPGLVVASTDDREAYDDVPKAVELLIEVSFGVKCRAIPKRSYDDFISQQGITSEEREHRAIALDRTRELMAEDAEHEYVIVPTESSSNPMLVTG